MFKALLIVVVVVVAAFALLVNTPLGKCVRAGYERSGMATSALYACVK